MAYGNYLVKIGSYIFPLSKMQEKSYSAKVNTLDKDSYNDMSGKLHREVIQRIPKVTFQTMEMTETELRPIMTSIQANYSNTNERKASVSVWVAEWGQYVTQDMYISDTDFKIDYIDSSGVIHYEAITFTLAGYGV